MNILFLTIFTLVHICAVSSVILSRQFIHRVVSANLFFGVLTSLPENTLSLDFSSQTEQYVNDGVNYFKEGSFQKSVKAFDSAISANRQITPYLWQRGLALYFNEQYKECAEQFRTDVAVNPQDTEEAIWNYVCMKDAEEKDLSMIILSGTDRRPVLRTTLDVFTGRKDWQELSQVGLTGGTPNYFYSRLYLSLYFYTHDDHDKAMNFIEEAMKSQYTKSAQGRDLMVDVGKFFKQKLSAS